MRTQQERTVNSYNLHLCDKFDCDSGEVPSVMPTSSVPRKLECFRNSSKIDPDAFLHFFVDDYRFEGLWNRPERYIDMLSKYAGVLAPDFSLYTDMPLPMQRWNVYRQRVLTRYWQDNGIDVIPVLSWSDEDSYDFAFDGLPEGSTVAVATVGVARNKSARELFQKGLEAALARVKPKTLIVYGDGMELDVQGKCEVVRFNNSNKQRVMEAINGW